MNSERQAFNDGFDKGFGKALDEIDNQKKVIAELLKALKQIRGIQLPVGGSSYVIANEAIRKAGEGR